MARAGTGLLSQCMPCGNCSRSAEVNLAGTIAFFVSFRFTYDKCCTILGFLSRAAPPALTTSDFENPTCRVEVSHVA